MTDEKNAPQPDDDIETSEPTSELGSEPMFVAASGTPDGTVSGTAEVPADSDDPDVSYDSVSDAFAALTDGPDAVDPSAPPQYGVGPFSVREVALGAIWVVAFVISFFPIYNLSSAGSVWTAGIDWVLTIGVPTIAVFLVGLRRLSPQGIRRVGSLGVDQFASVAFSVSAVVWLGILWASFVALAGQRLFYATWVVWLEFILMLAGVLLTVFAPLFPTIREDFRHRTEVPAHRVASPARPVIARPALVHSAPAAVTVTAAGGAVAPSSAADTGAVDRLDEAAVITLTQADPVMTEPTDAVVPPASQAFWALAPVERDVVDETGAPLFTIGPSAWALVLEDRGESFVVRHEDGRIGYLTDVSGITRG